MPTKLGMGGEGQEQYNPNDGQYVEDGVPNKSYDNPQEKLNNLFGLLNKNSVSKRYGEKRKQLPYFGKKFLKKYGIDDPYDVYYGSKPNSDFINESNDFALFQLMEETGYSFNEAKKLQNCLVEYFGGDYKMFRNGQRPNETKIINEALKRMGTYDGNIYRGMTFNQVKQEEKQAFQEMLNNLQIGNTLNMNSITSWSSKRQVAKGYATIYDDARDQDYFKCDSILFVVKNNKSAVGMQHISKFGDGESEVVAPSTAKYLVKNRKIKKENEIDHFGDIKNTKTIAVFELEEI